MCSPLWVLVVVEPWGDPRIRDEEMQPLAYGWCECAPWSRSFVLKLSLLGEARFQVDTVAFLGPYSQ